MPSKTTYKRVKERLMECTLEGYLTGIDRRNAWFDSLTAHVYKGGFHDPKKGMCKRSMDEYGGFSIFRNNVGRKGICKTCIKAVVKELALPTKPLKDKKR